MDPAVSFLVQGHSVPSTGIPAVRDLSTGGGGVLAGPPHHNCKGSAVHHPTQSIKVMGL